MIRAIIDTTTLLSGIGWEGKPKQILNYWLDNKFTIVTSPEILEEVREVFFRSKFDFIDIDKKNEFILNLASLAEIIYPTHKVDICRDKDDNKFIEAAISAKVNFIVSSDKDLQVIKEYNGIKIISVDEFLKILK